MKSLRRASLWLFPLLRLHGQFRQMATCRRLWWHLMQLMCLQQVMQPSQAWHLLKVCLAAMQHLSRPQGLLSYVSCACLLPLQLLSYKIMQVVDFDVLPLWMSRCYYDHPTTPWPQTKDAGLIVSVLQHC